MNAACPCLWDSAPYLSELHLEYGVINRFRHAACNIIITVKHSPTCHAAALLGHPVQSTLPCSIAPHAL